MTTTFDPFDELAAMFLTSPSAVEIGSRPTSAAGPRAPKASGVMHRRPAGAALIASPTVELLIAGHLPVRGALWLTPYADAIARKAGATALLRLDADEPSLQLLRASTDLATKPDNRSLQRTIQEIGAGVDFWIVRPSATEPSIELIQSGADRITILSSADEAAMVAAYQQVKDLAQAAQQLGCSLPAIGLAIVGSDDKNAAAVVERFNRTTGSFLDVKVTLAMCLPRMDAGVKSTRWEHFNGETSLADVMQSIGHAKASGARRDSRSDGIAGQVHADRIDDQVVQAEQILNAAPTVQASKPLRSASQSATDAEYLGMAEDEDSAITSNTPSVPSAELPHHALKLIPKPAVRWEPKNTARILEPDDHGQPVPLASHVKGLTTLPIRSPGHERIELAIDSAGRLHLLGREQSLREMAVVEKWSKAHRELIAMACPKHKIDHAAKPVLHIFSAEPLALADLHGSDLRLHVLAPVVVNGQTGWYAAPLNAVS